MLVLLADFAGAQTNIWFDWNACVAAALAGNPDLVAAGLDVDGAAVDVDKANSGRLPQVKASGSARTSDSSDGETYSAGVSASQLIYDMGRSGGEVDRARVGELAARADLESVSADVRYQLRTAYVKALKAQRLTDLSAEILKRREDSTRLIRLRYEAGREHRGSLLTAEAKEAEARLEQLQAARSQELAYRELAVVMGMTRAQRFRVKGDVAAPALPTVAPDVEALAAQTPAARRQSLARDSAELALDVTRAGRGPTVQASAEAGRSGPWPPDEDSWSAGIGLSMPIFEGGGRSAAIRRAGLDLEAVDARTGQDFRRLVETLRQRWVDYQNSVERAGIREKYREATTERAKIAEAQYSGGLLLFDNWIIIENEFVEAEKALVNAQADAMQAEAAWALALGRTLDEKD